MRRHPSYDFYQYWINVDDADVERLLMFYTFLPEGHIRALTAVEGEALREAKRALAREVTALTHGVEAMEQAEAATRALFSGAPDLDDPNIPTTEIPVAEVGEMTLADAFIRAGLIASRGEARRKAAEGALWMDGERLDYVDEPFRPSGADALLRFGKKRYRRIHIV